jgi:putative ABC transport system permease protein
MLRELWQDSRYGVRMLLKQPGFTSIAVLTLALGIGANTAIYSLMDKLIVRSLPIKEPATLVLLQGKALSDSQFETFFLTEFSWADYLDYRAKNRVFTDLTAMSQSPVNLGSGDQMERVRAELVSDNYFETLGVRPSLGRDFLPDENKSPGAHPVAMISYSLWRSRFGGDPKVVGQTVQLNESSYTIIGVAPSSFKGLEVESPVDVWVPAMMRSQIAQMRPEDDDWVGNRGAAVFKLLGRLKPGSTKEGAQAAMDTLARQVRDSYLPKKDERQFFNLSQMMLVPAGKGISPLRDKISGTLELLFAVVGLILIIACANVANLLLARSASRRKEIAIRLALGAGRVRLVRQLLTESMILAAAGGAAGMLLAPWLSGLPLFYQAGPEAAGAVLDHSINWRVAAFTLLVASLTGLLFGLLPALQASRPDLIPAIKEEGASQADRSSFNLSRRALIIAQVALSMVVLVSAGLFLRSLGRLLAIDPGFSPEKVLVAELELPMSKYNTERSQDFYRRLLERLKALPGVESVATANYTPLGGTVSLAKILVEGQAANAGELPTAFNYTVSAGYHELMGIRLLQGRGFTAEDRKGAPNVAIVNEALARRFFPGGNALGKKISLGVGEPWMEIVGVTRDVKSLGLILDRTDLQLDLPVEQHDISNPQRVLVRARHDAADLLASVRREVRAFDPGLSFFKTKTLKDDLLANISTQRMLAGLISLFGALALLLASIGLYGVIAYSVSHRTREIGIRMALGAQAGDVLKLVMREGLLLIAIGLSIGLASAWGATRLIKGYLYSVSASDPLTFIAIAVLLIIVTSLACWIPARRAAKVDPMIALRYE